jgi:hypothetical protein
MDCVVDRTLIGIRLRLRRGACSNKRRLIHFNPWKGFRLVSTTLVSHPKLKIAHESLVEYVSAICMLNMSEP